MPITVIPRQPVALNVYDPNNDCFGFDETYCQQVQHSDSWALEFWAALCTGDLVTCGNFASSTCVNANWFSNDASSALNGWSFSGITYTRMNHTIGMTDYLQQNGILTTLMTYKITFTIVRVANPLIEIQGSVTPYAGTTPGTAVTQAGTYTQYIVASGTNLKFLPSSNFDGAIEDISCYQVQTSYYALLKNSSGVNVGVGVNKTQFLNGIVYFSSTWSAFGGGSPVADGCYQLCISDGTEIGGCCDTEPFADLVVNGSFSVGTSWTLGAGWSIVAGKATHAAGVAGSLTQNLCAMTINKTYNVSITVSGRTAGSINVSLAGTLLTTISSNGTFNISGIPNASGSDITIAADSSFDGSVDDISVTIAFSSYPQSACTPCYDLKTTHSCTRLLEWSNGENAFGMFYQYPITPALHHRLRCQVIFDAPTYPEEKEVYTDSIGAQKMLFFSSRKQFKLKFDYLPQYLLDALSIAKGHDYFWIDSVEYSVVSGDLAPAWRDRKKVAQMEFDIQETPQLEQNLNCS